MSFPVRKTRQIMDNVAGSKGGMYKAGGKEVPDARRAQNEANNKHIPVIIVEKLQTAEFAEIVVRATDPETGHHAPGVVHHDFAVVQQLKALQMLEKEVEGKDIFFRGKPIKVFKDLSEPFTPEGNPNLTPLGFLKLLTEMANFKNFSLRDATTKATRIAQLKILNKEWREKGEIRAEKDEEKAVKQSISDEKKSNQKANPDDQITKEANNIADEIITKTNTKQRVREVKTVPKGHENAVDAQITVKEGGKPNGEDAITEDMSNNASKDKPEVHDMVPFNERLTKISKELGNWYSSFDIGKEPNEETIIKKSMDLLGTGGITEDKHTEVKRACGIVN
jgi:hypothetical protein